MEEILNFLERKDLIKNANTWTDKPLNLPFELKPRDFVKFAEEDFKKDDERSLINALSNIKRSIDCRIESLLYLFGVYERVKREDWNFPKKTDFLLKVGVVAPRILTKINKRRNEIEHEFKKPTRVEVEDFLDVANLFLLYTERFVDKTYDYFEWELESDLKWPWIKIYLDSQKGSFELELIKGPKENSKTKISIEDEENYIKVLKYWVGCILSR